MTSRKKNYIGGGKGDRDGEEKEKKTAHSEPDVVSLSDFARCQEDLRGMPTSASVHAPVS